MGIRQEFKVRKERRQEWGKRCGGNEVTGKESMVGRRTRQEGREALR